MKNRRILLCALVLLSAANLPSCSVTQYQRDQDAIQDALRELHSPDMERRIAEARGMKVAR